MAEVFCNQCGHRNALGANFCSSCGAPLEHEPGERTTITFSIDVPPEAPEDEVTFDLDDIPEGAGLLVVTRGPNAGSRLALTKPVTTVGRHPDSDIFLDDITVSRRHAELQRVESGFLVRDVGSLNGTYLNRERVEESPIQNGDELQVGKFKLAFFAGPSESS
jgi:pSer/pThr/pTyr-binding forkhead associated (FHA) protein